ncbi:hypothetical protein Tco_0593027 [Tanacetum coccineum]
MYYKKNLDFMVLIWEDLAYQIDNIDSKKQDKMFFPRFTKIIIHHFLEKDKFISMRNRIFMHTARDDSLLAEPLISRKSQKKSDLAISSKESPSKKKSAKAKKVVAPKPKPNKKKTLVKADKGKGLNVLLEVALFEVPDEKHLKTIGADEGTSTILGVPNVPKYDYESKKESWGDRREEDKDDENDFEDKSDDGDDDDNGNDGNDDDDANDDDNQEGDDMNENDEKTDKEENIDDEEMMDDEEDDEVTKELYKDVNVNLGIEDVDPF